MKMLVEDVDAITPPSPNLRQGTAGETPKKVHFSGTRGHTFLQRRNFICEKFPVFGKLLAGYPANSVNGKTLVLYINEMISFLKAILVKYEGSLIKLSVGMEGPL